MQRSVGIINVIQESRFRLDCEDGRSLQFTLDSHAPIEPQDLPRFRGAPVAVLHAGSAGMAAMVARDIHQIGHQIGHHIGRQLGHQIGRRVRQ